MAEVFEIDTTQYDMEYRCVECGEVLTGNRTKYCPEHAANRTASNRPAASTKRKQRPSSGGKVDQTKAAGTFAKLFVVITAVIAWGRLKRLGIPDVNGSLAEDMSFTDEEAEPVAKVLARFTMSNSTTAKIVKPLVENDDMIDAAFALWEWNKRTEAVLAQYRQNTVQDRMVVQNVPTGQGTQSAGESGGADGGIVIPYNGNADFRSLV